MSPVKHYKDAEEKAVHIFLRQCRVFLNLIVQGMSKLISFGKKRISIMLVPHSENKMLNFQLSIFAIVFIFFIFALVLGSFLVLAVNVSGIGYSLKEKESAVRKLQASSESLREEIAQVEKLASGFKKNFDETIGIIGIERSRHNSAEALKGDFSSFFDVEESSKEVGPEISALKELQDFFSSASKPVTEMNDALVTQKELLVDIPTLWPVKDRLGRVTNPFGPAQHPFYGQWYLHKGIDIAYSTGIPLVATANGKVVSVEYEPLGFGNYIIIKHKYGFYTRYAHMQRIDVTQGQTVQRGQMIGTMGSTGLSTGAHVHYEVRIGSQVVDPAKYLSISSDILKK